MANASKMMSGSPLLQGDNTIPGVPIHSEFVELLPEIERKCREMGLDYYPIVCEFVRYDEMSELASYGGFPVRFPHWKWGMEYEQLARGYEFNQYRISEMVINCLGLDTDVLTNRGTICADSVKVGDMVYSGAGKLRKVVAVEKQAAGKTCFIKIKGFGRGVSCSLNHKWKVMTDAGYDWKKAKHLHSGDILVGGDTYDAFVNSPAKLKWNMSVVSAATIFSSRKFLKDISPDEKMTLELAELLGAVVGDGSCGVVSKENQIYVSVDKTLNDYCDYLESLFFRVFKTEAIIEDKGAVNQVTMCSKAAVDFFDYIGHKKGCTHKTKRVPWSIWKSSHEYRTAFLRGLFDTDGSSSGVINFSCYNHDLACDVQLLLREIGIGSHCFRTDNGKNEISIVRVQGKQNVAKFHARIGFSLDYKNEWLEELVNVGNSTNRGIPLSYVQKLVVDLGEALDITTYSNPSLGRTLKLMQRKVVGSNVLVGFMSRLKNSREYMSKYVTTSRIIFDKVDEIEALLFVPYFEVLEVTNGLEAETVDIALDHGDHDFMASGLVTHNTNPCYIYFMDSNTLVDNVDVACHAIGHNDFFKNNIFFAPTDGNMMNKLANHGIRIRRYMARWGFDVVEEFIDHVLRIETLIDPQKAWKEKKINKVNVKDEREYRFPTRLKPTHDYMEDWVNPTERRDKENEKIGRKDARDFLDIFGKPQRDVMGYLKAHAPLKPWQQDIISMLYDESMYFAPQRATKMLNEGWASYVDYHLLCREGMAALGQGGHDCGVWQYAKHKMNVLGGKYSMNPYKLGFELFLDVEDRWNKGRFGSEYDDCQNMREREKWDKEVGKGREKVFEVRQYYNDYTAIQEFFTPEFCEKKKFYEYRRFPNGEWKIINRDFDSIKDKLLKRYLNGGLPDIRLADPNHLGKGWFFLQHFWDGRPLYPKYVREVLSSTYRIWQNVVVIATQNMDGVEFVYLCDGKDPEKSIHEMTREDYEREFVQEGK